MTVRVGPAQKTRCHLGYRPPSVLPDVLLWVLIWILAGVTHE